MQTSRAAALSLTLLALALSACGSPGPESTPSPRAEPARSPSDRLAVVSSSSSPTLVDRSCADFASPDDAQEFYIEAGGPDQDLHGLDPDHNGNACDDQGAFPTSAATVGTPRPVPVTAPTSQPPTERPRSEVHTTQGVVAGESGGSGTQSSCESSDPEHCD